MPNPQWMADIVTRLQAYLPQLVAAAVLALGGWLLALLLRVVTGRLLSRILERVRRNAELREAVDDPGIRATIPMVIAAFVFWVTWLFFLSAAVESLGFTVVTDLLSEVTNYLPDVLAAIVIVVGGVIVGRFAHRAGTAAAQSAGVLHADRVGRAGQVLVMAVAAVVALDQIGIDAQLLVVLMTVVLGAAFGSAGLAFGLGARSTVGNIIASHYFARTYRVGQTIRIGAVEGEILQTTPTAVVLGTPDGRLLIPARRFSEEPSLLLERG